METLKGGRKQNSQSVSQSVKKSSDLKIGEEKQGFLVVFCLFKNETSKDSAD